MKLKTIGLLSLLMWLALSHLVPAVAAAASQAEDLVRNTTEEVLSLLKQHRGSTTLNQAQINELVAEKVLPHFDFAHMTRLAAGRNWTKISDGQKETLVEEFRKLLVRTYSVALTGYQDQTIEYPSSPTSTDADHAVVKTRIRRDGSTAISIDYRLDRTESGWKVYDILVDGISLVVTYRSSFNSTIESSGVDKLIEMLREKNAAVANDAPA